MIRDSKCKKIHFDDDTIRVLDSLRPKLISVAFGIVHDFYQANECVQDVVEQLWLSEKTDNIKNIEAYAVTMLKRNIAKYYKSKKKTSDMFKDISDYENIIGFDYIDLFSEKRNRVELVNKSLKNLKELDLTNKSIVILK